MSDRDDLKALADDLARRFVAKGFTVHRYDAYSTDSVYLKLDWGACNSVRISDHTGKKHLKYRYNIGSWIKEGRHEGVNGKYPRHYYQAKHADRLVKRAVADREERIEKRGEDGYRSLVDLGREQAASARSGFWPQARKVGA